MRKKNAAGQSIAVSALLMAALFLLPLVVVAPFQRELLPEKHPVLEKEQKPFVSGKADGERLLRVLHNGEVTEMDLGTYLVGVVRAEMPASFELEALKAQTVAARTYTLYKLSTGGNHGETAHICTDHTCCQAWLDEETARANWGADADAYEEKVERAVRETDGEVVLYQGEPILAVFHSSSAGRTRGAEDVWTSALPYLQPVDSPEPGETIPNYYSRVEFQQEAFCRLLQSARPEADLSGDPAAWLQDAATDEAGSVLTVTIGGVRMKGSELRSILGLRSACFTWEVEEDSVVFFVTGYGHGVGMSQYGASAMAAEGTDYRDILTHYYTGTTVGPWQG